MFYGNDITAEIGSPTDAAILAPFITTRFPLIALISQLLTCKCYVITGLWGIHRERLDAASRRHQRRRDAAEAINKTTITFQYLREQMSYIALKEKKLVWCFFFLNYETKTKPKCNPAVWSSKQAKCSLMSPKNVCVLSACDYFFFPSFVGGYFLRPHPEPRCVLPAVNTFRASAAPLLSERRLALRHLKTARSHALTPCILIASHIVACYLRLTPLIPIWASFSLLVFIKPHFPVR